MVCFICTKYDRNIRLHSAVDITYDCSSRGRKFKSKVGHITFMEGDHEIISAVILLLLMIQGVMLSAVSLSSKRVVR